MCVVRLAFVYGVLKKASLLIKAQDSTKSHTSTTTVPVSAIFERNNAHLPVCDFTE